MFEDDEVLVAGLPSLERSLLSAIRGWVIAQHSGRDARPAVADMFDRLDAVEATPTLLGFMSVLGHGVTRTIEVNCTCRHTVSAEERLLLDVLAMQQEGMVEDAAACLLGIATERSALLAADHALRLVLSLQAAGHRLDASEVMPRLARIESHGPVRLVTPAVLH